MSSLAGVPVDQSNVNNLKDILSTYNRITEACFVRCAANFNSRELTTDEESCISHCSSKLINSNQRLMGTFMEVQTKRQEAMAEEMEAKAKEENEKAMQSLQDPSTVPAPEPETASNKAKDSFLKGMNLLFSVGKKTEQQSPEQQDSLNQSSVDQNILTEQSNSSSGS